MPKINDKFYVTTPIYYVTAKPHLGSLYSTVLADVAKRWHKLCGQETFFLTGTDEHGQKVAQAALVTKKEPGEFVESFIAPYKELWSKYYIDYDYFIRTTDKSHKTAVQQWIKRLQENGQIYKAYYKGWYCTPCESFITEKDQESVGENVLCTSCNRPTQYISEESYFFKLSDYTEKLLKFYNDNPDFITPSERYAEVISFVKSGLKDLSISRTTVSWGIEFPNDTKHTTYVWADALNNYITAIGYADPNRQEEFNFWWPADMQVMGKDIIRFHAIYWPAFLMACDLEMPKKLLVHGWIKVNQQKMSKSLANVVDPQDLLQNYGPDEIRYYLVKHMAITQDSEFSIKDLETRLNSDLANDLGNLLNRVIILAYKNNLINVEPPKILGEAELKLRDLLFFKLAIFKENMNDGYFYRAYNALWEYIHEVNTYFHLQQPWKIADDKQRFSEIISATCHSLYYIAILAWPCMPKKMELLLKSLGIELDFNKKINYISKFDSPWNMTFLLSKIDPLFVKYENKESLIQELEQNLSKDSNIEKKLPEIAQNSTSTLGKEKKETTMENKDLSITIDDLVKVKLVVGKIESCVEIPKSDKLFQLQVNFGTLGNRQILSGIKKYYKPEELIGQKAVFVYNLAPRPMMGLESHGMVLTTQDQEQKVRIIKIDQDIESGTVLK